MTGFAGALSIVLIGLVLWSFAVIAREFVVDAWQVTRSWWKLLVAAPVPRRELDTPDPDDHYGAVTRWMDPEIVREVERTLV